MQKDPTKSRDLAGDALRIMLRPLENNLTLAKVKRK
jgi:hypothetical protein